MALEIKQIESYIESRQFSAEEIDCNVLNK
jgi:hypothetical protein